jgi:STE24 endopeptidase
MFGWLWDFLLTKMNVRHLKVHGHGIPEALMGYVDHDKLSKITDYTVDNHRFAMVTSFLGNTCFVLALLSGLFPWLFHMVESAGWNSIVSGTVFLASLGLAQTVFSLPFDYYKTFVIEQRYGFNTSSRTIWFTDMMKGLVLGSVIGGILLVAMLCLLQYTGHLWWIWGWCLFFGFQLLLALVYPTVIAPWFNTFVPLQDASLAAQIEDMMHQGGLSVKGVFSMDAGKRSRHTNAYFTGLGTTKRIVIFDTLVESHSHGEILAILAHEIGHWKMRHVLKKILLIGFFSLFLFYGASRLLTWQPLFEAFGFPRPEPYVGLFLFAILWHVLSDYFVPLGNALSRHHERQADAFAARFLKDTTDLAHALKRLARENMANLYPHSLYAWFHYSHPPILERIRDLVSLGQEGA